LHASKQQEQAYFEGASLAPVENVLLLVQTRHEGAVHVCFRFKSKISDARQDLLVDNTLHFLVHWKRDWASLSRANLRENMVHALRNREYQAGQERMGSLKRIA